MARVALARRRAGDGLGHVASQRPELAETAPQAQRPGLIVLGQLRTAIESKSRRQTVEQGSLQEFRRADGIRPRMVAPGAKAEFAAPFAQHKRNCGIGLSKGAHRTIALGHLHLQIAALRGGVKIADGKCPRRHEGFVDHIPVLRDGHFGIAVHHAADGGGKAALAVRKHLIIRHQLDAAKGDAVKHIAGGVGIADPQQALQRADVALQPGALGIPVPALLVVLH
ncbi:Uncharacterised protein [Klebsiella variicola]|nr:Uncharacterised protein [Klebsiella variicola]